MKEVLKRLKFVQDSELNKISDLNLTLKPQNPHSLFIGCCDSRVLPSNIVGSGPGDIFTIKNIANIIPPLNQSSENCSTIAALEYAVLELDVKNIIVCGHSNCGGCAALTATKEDLLQMPNLYKWLSFSQDALLHVENFNDPEMIEKENVIQQLRHLLSYPYVIESVEKGDINLLGIYYHLKNGKIDVYNEEKEAFLSLDEVYER